MDNFYALLTSLDKKTSDNDQSTVDWFIKSVQEGSIQLTAEAQIVNESVDENRPSEIIQSLRSGLSCLKTENHYPEEFSIHALKTIKTFSNLIDPNDFAEITLQGLDWYESITKNLSSHVDELISSSYKHYGSVEGQLISIKIARGSSFGMGIKTPLQSRIIKCSFDQDSLLQSAKDALGKRVYVFGVIRQNLYGDKINVKVQEIRQLPDHNNHPSPTDILQMLRG